MRLRHVATGIAAVSTHAVIGFTHEALYSAAGDLVIEPKIVKWLSSYGWIVASAMLFAMLALQLYIDWPVLRKDARNDERMMDSAL